MSIGLISAAYVVAAILFILALGGLSNQEKAKRAIYYGIAGMALAVGATVGAKGVGNFGILVIMVAIGGVIGWFVANRVQMTQMPELVAGFHSLVGLAAVFIGINADLEMNAALSAKEAGTVDQLAGFAATIAKKTPVEITILKVELFLGILIGAITFTGSIIAYGKLAGKLSSAALTLPFRHQLNLLAFIACFVFGLVVSGRCWALDNACGGRHLRSDRLPFDHGDRRRGYARGGLHAQLLFGLGGGGHRLHLGQRSPDRHRRSCGLVRRDPLLHHV